MDMKKLFSVLIIIGVLGIFAYMVFADFSGLGVTVVSPTGDENYSGTLILNATTNSTLTTTNSTNATFFFYNASTGVLVYNITFENATDNDSRFNTTIDTTDTGLNLSDGTYNLTVNVTNSTDVHIQNDSITEVQIDNTAPSVTINTPLPDTFLGTGTTSLVFNVTVTDTGSGVFTVINLSNSSETNETASQVGNGTEREFNRTVVVGELVEGNNTLTVAINDTIITANGGANLNNSENVTVWLDTALPTVDLISPENYTWTTDTTPALTFNFTDDTSPNATCELIVDDTTVATNTTVLNDTGAGIILSPDSALTIGEHDWTVNCTDLGDNTAMSSANYTIDVVEAPTLTLPTNVTYIGATGATNYTAGGTNFTFNFSSDIVANDVTNNTSSCELFIVNASSGDVANGVNRTTYNGTSTTIANNQTLVLGGEITWYVNCTYNSTVITSDVYTVLVDVTAPTVSLDDTQYLQNYTWTTDTTPDLVYNFTDGASPNASCELFINETGYGTGYNINSTVLNDTQTTVTVNDTLSVGTYTWYVNCTDLGNNVGTSLDTTNFFNLEVVNPIAVTGRVNNSWTNETKAGNETFTFTYASRLTNGNGTNDNSAVSCDLYIANNSAVFLANGVNTTTLNNTATTIRNNQTIYATGSDTGNTINSYWLANWTINCTFNGSDITQVVDDAYFNLNLDNITPSTPTLSKNTVSSSSSTLVIDLSTSTDVDSCEDTDPDTSIEEVSNGNWQVTKGGLNANSAYDFQIICDDRADNSVQSLQSSFTTDEETGGGGSGGAGGGSSSSAVGDFAQTTWASINEGETATIEVENGEIGVTDVSFTVEEKTYGAWVKVERIASLPSTVDAYSGQVYKNIKISATNVEKVMKDTATIDFKVAKSWLSENSIGRNNVVLLRYTDDAWTELETGVVSDDDTFVYYTAEAPGFSYFVIAEKVGSAPVTAEEEVRTEAPPTVGEAVEEAAEVVAETAKSSAIWLIPLIVLVVVAVLLYFYWRRRS